MTARQRHEVEPERYAEFYVGIDTVKLYESETAWVESDTTMQVRE